VRTAPDIFQLGAAGYSRVIRDVTELDLPSLREAEELCPTRSILLETLDDDDITEG
jgi:ferredoxin